MYKSIPLLLICTITLSGCEAAFSRYERSDHWQKAFFVQADVLDLVVADDVALMATNRGFFYSDNFESFYRSGANVPRNANIVAYGFSPKRWDIYAVTEYGYLLRSTDRGKTFDFIGEFPSIQIYDMSLTSGGQLFVASSSGLLVSDLDDLKSEKDDRKTHFLPWEMLVMALPIWRRANLGSDTDPWHDWSVVLPGNVFRVVIDPAEHGHLFAEVLDEGIYQSWDMGSSWEPVHAENGARVRGPIAFGPDGRVMIGAFFSNDNGESFTPLRMRADITVERTIELTPGACAINSDGLWIIDYASGSIFRSKDTIRWVRAGRPIDFYATKGKHSAAFLTVDPTGGIWVGTDGHGLFRHVK